MDTYPPEVLKRLQATELKILEAINQVCRAHNIMWFLIGGSALGALRHGGFIPWDDDIDIGMLRQDYERFIKIAPNALPSDYLLATPENTPGYAAMFIKVYKKGTRFYTQDTLDAGVPQGIFIDIFPFDPIWSDKKKRARQYRSAKKYTILSYLYHSPHVSLKFHGIASIFLPFAFKISHFVFKKCLNPRALRKRFNTVAQACNEKEAVGYTSLPHPYSSPLPKEVFVPPILTSFEGRQYPIPADTPRYLTNHYKSDWRQLPPEDERKTHCPLILDFGDGINTINA